MRLILRHDEVIRNRSSRYSFGVVCSRDSFLNIIINLKTLEQNESEHHHQYSKEMVNIINLKHD